MKRNVWNLHVKPTNICCITTRYVHKKIKKILSKPKEIKRTPELTVPVGSATFGQDKKLLKKDMQRECEI